jgi:streptomycin 6-kinase
MSIPTAFTQTILDLHQERGAEWLSQLPALLQECAQRWSLTIGAPFSLSYNYVAPAERADGSAVVLKLGYPGRELLNEIDALRLYNGDGIVQLLDCNRDKGVLLLERLQPGEMLSTLADDEAATTIGAEVMRKLWRPAPIDHAFPTVADWAKGLEHHRERFAGGVGPLPKRLFEEAEALFQELLAANESPMLLHGDLHHFNILRAQRQPWLAIDPKGLVGDPAYEVGAFLYNPDLSNRSNLNQLLQRRVAQLAEQLNFDWARVRGWGVAQAVLSACWSMEDHGHGWEYVIDIGERLSALHR